ncbi:conjugal transfer protein [Nocardia sp. NPDC059091]|uniref:conjugal transfer protein n=1 Tax=unclassified Nocardia TaxID=2637762 RepID=UPI003684D79B
MSVRRRRENIIVAVLASLAVLGGGHAILDAFSTPPPGPSDSSTISLIGRERLAEWFAREFIVVYLGASAGQQDKIAEFVGGTGQVVLPASARQVVDPTVVYATRSVSNGDIDVWTVTVSVRVAKRPGSTDDARQFYRVAVSVVGGRLRALSLPAVVEPPAHGSDLVLDYATSCTQGTPLAEVAGGFLQAMLTGSGDITRYVTTDSGISALRPAPFTTVETAAVSADDSGCGATTDRARVLATVNLKTDGGAAPALTYPLTMVREAGQWQVQAMDPVPALRSPLQVATDQGRETSPPSASATRPPSSAVRIPPPTQK